MRFSRILSPSSVALAVALAAPLLLPEGGAAACGGTFGPPTQEITVASHRMILSVSQAQSTLYDEIEYTGDPASFAWVLPIQGTVTVGLSSDALFSQLDQMTTVVVDAPPISCGCFPNAGDTSGSATASGGGEAPDAGGVTILSQAVVGPYETVQLSSTDPTALTSWLSTNGYSVPANVAPVIASYVNGGFNFLALKLVPGTGITAMRPVSVTTPGASPSLPLQMVAAGAGTTMPITLFVVGEGRYQPVNFPWFVVDPGQVTWDFTAGTSNYLTVQQAGFTANANAWAVESAQASSESLITASIMDLAQYYPTDSGYADSMGNGAPAAAQADLDTLFSGIATGSLWITRLFAQMPRTALSSDLTVGAAASQTPVPNELTAGKYVNCAPGCSGTGAGGSGGASGNGGATGSGASTGSGSGKSSCAVDRTGSDPFSGGALGGAIAALALAAARRRRGR